MADEKEQTTKKEKRQDIDEKLGITFMICFGLGVGYYLTKTFDERFEFDLEKKAYIPYSINNDLYLINQKNGKTYLLEKHEIDNQYWYTYKYLTKTKTNKIKMYSKNNPLNINQTAPKGGLDFTRRK